jgi:mRNA interferase RelE/StbE
LSPVWTYEFAASARRDLKRLDPPIRRRIVDALDRLTRDTMLGDVKQLRPGLWRLRVGAWRVIFERDVGRAVISVLRVEHRSRAYRR